MLMPCRILQESDNQIPGKSLLIHPGAKMMIAFCPQERGPQHLGHAPPEKLVFLCVIPLCFSSFSMSLLFALNKESSL